MTIREWLDLESDKLADSGDSDGLVILDGYDDCIVGVVTRIGFEPFVVYDKEKILQKLMSEQYMTREEAEEFFDFNQAGAWVGDHTPGFITLPPRI
jgi:hypothetical protein